MTGIIILDKPAGITSFGAVARIRRLTGEKRCGHGGTLDPEAEGILPVLLGKATRLSDVFLTFHKTYEAELTFGLLSDTGDIWGNVVRAADAAPGEAERERMIRALGNISREDLESVLPEFTGTVTQTPPAYSALKTGGVPAYKLARRGMDPELKPRQVEIFSVLPGTFRNTFPENGALPTAGITVTCGRGTYIRTLCEDIGKRLGVPAVMSRLDRVSYGSFGKACSVGPETLEKILAEAGNGEGTSGNDAAARLLIKEGILLPCDAILGGLPAVRLTGSELIKYTGGIGIVSPENGTEAPDDRDAYETCGPLRAGDVRVYGPDGKLYGIGSFASGSLRSRINLSGD